MVDAERPSPPEPSERLFLALWPDDDVRAQLVSVRQAFSPEGGRWVAAENLHLTLAFLGATTAARRACLERMLSTVDARAFDLALEAVRYRRQSGMVWLATAEVPVALRDLVAALNAALAPCGYVPDSRAFRAHVTLARNVRRLGPPPALAPITWKVTQFCLVSSNLTPNGSRYSIARRWPLSGDRRGD